MRTWLALIVAPSLALVCLSVNYALVALMRGVRLGEHRAQWHEHRELRRLRRGDGAPCPFSRYRYRNGCSLRADRSLARAAMLALGGRRATPTFFRRRSRTPALRLELRAMGGRLAGLERRAVCRRIPAAACAQPPVPPVRAHSSGRIRRAAGWRSSPRSTRRSTRSRPRFFRRT